ncbi:3-hydroxyacyl-CoA dehydrogenase NAD-binding domain-containing protein [Labrys neptuniae]
METVQFSDSVAGKVYDSILVVAIDNPPVNALSVHTRAGLMAALDHAAGQETIGGVVLTGAGALFVGGADIKEFGQPPLAPILPDVVARIEGFAKPVVAAVNGAALGGGAELTLACHGRVAGSKARFAFPEVKLGIVPGAGGTQRLPRLVGVASAIDLIASSRPIGAEEARACGLADAVADDAVAAAMVLAHRMASTPLRRTGSLPVPLAEAGAADAAATKALAKARGQAAPVEAVRLVSAASDLSLQEGLAEERATFLRLLGSDEAAALRHVFFAERAAGKVDRLAGITPRAINIIGIVGLGLMGSGIAVAALTAGYRVIGVEQTAVAAEVGGKRIAGLLDKAVQSGRLAVGAREACLARFSTAADIAALAEAELVIEAVFDDLAVKTELFRKLDHVVAPGAVLATNTSYLDPDAIATATARPERVVGLHFFSPANIMRLVEVVDCKATTAEVLALTLAFARRLGKLPIVSGVTEGFIGNRVYSAYRREAEFMVEDGAAPQDVDAALEAWGFAMGIFAVNDMAGLEIAWARRKRQASTRDPGERYVAIADRLCEAGRFGRKTGAGWYDYASGKRAVDPAATALIEAARAEKSILPRNFTPGEIVARLLEAMADEGKALLIEGIAARAGDIDLVMINGYGFPAHKGGPMFQASLKSSADPPAAAN